jgi:quercetin 2,3-dioxygenase
MVQVRRSSERGHAQRGWLDSYHTFSFADYYDPRHMGFRSLRVINEDWIEPGRGFGEHPHNDMEIITYVVEGALAHRDSTGTEEVIRPGEVQRMTAGSGITHSEYNDSGTERVHLLQIWILPERKGLRPGYEQRAFPDEEKRGKLRLVAARDGRDGSVTVQQDVSLLAALLEPGQSVTHPLQPSRHAWVQVVRGAVTLNGQTLDAGDGAAVSEEETLEISGREPAEVLLFDLA